MGSDGNCSWASVEELRNWLAIALGDNILPFWRDGVLTITDGRMLVTLNCDEPGELFDCSRFRGGKWVCPELSHRRPPDTTRVLSLIGDECVGKIPIQDGPPPGANERWQVTATCDLCGGDGRAECDMGHWHDCDQCDGTGKEVETHPNARMPIRIGDANYQKRYVWVLSKLPGVKLCMSNDPHMLAARHQFGVAAIMSLND